MRFLPTLIFIAIGAFSVGGQTAAARLQEKAKAGKFHKEVLVSYDKFKDLTVVQTKPYNLIGGGESFAAVFADGLSRGPYGSGRGSGYPSALLMGIGFTFKGNPETVTPDKYFLIMTSNSGSWLFLKGDRNLYFLLNDKDRIELQPIDDDYDIGNRSVSETLAYAISRDQLAQIVNANRVELKLGNLPRKVKSEVGIRISYLLNLTETK